MAASVREHASACQAGCLSTEFRLSALPQASSALSRNVSGQDAFVIALVVLALVAAVASPPSGRATRTGGRPRSPCSTGSSGGGCDTAGRTLCKW